MNESSLFLSLFRWRLFILNPFDEFFEAGSFTIHKYAYTVDFGGKPYGYKERSYENGKW